MKSKPINVWNRITIVILFFCLNNSYIFSQNISGDSLIISIVPIEENGDSLSQLMYQLHIDSYMEIQNNESTEIEFYTTSKIGAILGPRNISASLLNDKNDPENYLEYQFEDGFGNQKIKIQSPEKKDFSIKLSYDIIGSGYFTYLNEESYPKVFFFHARQEKLYPLREGLIHKNVIISSIPTGTLLFNSRHMPTELAMDDELNLTLIEKKEYIKETYKSDIINWNVYFIDSITHEKYKEEEQHFVKDIQALTKKVPSPIKELDIVTANWFHPELLGSYGMGMSTYIICDTSFLNDRSSILHEAIHILYPMNIIQETKGKYFLGESTVEWIAQYIVKGKHEKMNRTGEKTGEITLYDIEKNYYNTWEDIYEKGTAILQNFADQVGSEELLNFLLTFMKTPNITYEIFIEKLKKSFPEEAVNDLDKAIRYN